MRRLKKPENEEWVLEHNTIRVLGSNEVVCDIYNTGVGLNGKARGELLIRAPALLKENEALKRFLSTLLKHCGNADDIELTREGKVLTQARELAEKIGVLAP